ncbi:MAG: 2-oxoacid:acceptor oxidoreductase family protein [Chloroflexi bacterium]|nr:2-oxoacid:acceptor oxidoreductase family protein [Chloroflexota bacterium]
MVTASNLLAQAALEDGAYFQSFPEFGAERSGAPIIAYTRISHEVIHIRSQVLEPTIVVILDATLIGRVDLLAGLQEGGAIIVNTPLSPEEMRDRLDARAFVLCTVDSTGIAQKLLGRNIPNVPMLGGLLKARPLVPQEAVLSTIQHRLSARLRGEVVRANVEAFRRAYAEARVGLLEGNICEAET